MQPAWHTSTPETWQAEQGLAREDAQEQEVEAQTIRWGSREREDQLLEGPPKRKDDQNMASP